MSRVGNASVQALAVTAALASALAVSAALLLAVGSPVARVLPSMLEYAATPRATTLIINMACVYYLSALAVAIAFRMGLFNIGVNGQYLLGSLTAGVIAGSLPGPGFAVTAAAVFGAMVAGAAWAGIAAWLKVVRGVSEVVSTIMLNFIASALMSFVIMRTSAGVTTSLNVRGTAPVPESAMLRGLPILDPDTRVYGFVPGVVAVGVLFWVVVQRTSFGFDLRATGLSPRAARVSGVPPNRMVVTSLLASGAIAGLVGLPYLLGSTGSFGLTFPRDWGWTGIAVALLGRNHPVGIAMASLVWAFLDIGSGRLMIDGIPRDIVTIMQGVTVVTVVLAYQVADRLLRRQERGKAGVQ